MGLEIERRFLIDKEKFPMRAHEVILGIKQGYLSSPSAKYVTRVRTVERAMPDGLSATFGYLTIKRKLKTGVAEEYEYSIPVEDARSLLSDPDGLLIFKHRHIIGPWEIDFFKGVHEGIAIAEIELEDINQEFERPDWLGREITDVKALSNFQMSQDSGLAKAVYEELLITQNKEAGHGRKL